jgi:hypothetical protein
MLTRNSQVGEFYVLQPPQVDPTDGGTSKSKAKFTCDILIYDEESDRHVRVTWGQALDACCINTPEDTTRGIAGANVKMSHPTTGLKGMDPNSDAARNYTGTSFPAQASLETWRSKAENIRTFNNGGDINYGDLDTDIRIVIARPFIEHLMHSVIMAVSGRDTGATLFGPADMQLSVS